MKTILEALLGVIALMVMLYIPFAFLIADLNPMTWHITLRGLYVLCIVSIITFAIKEYNKK